MPVHIWDPRWLTVCVGFAHKVIPMHYYIYVYIGGDVCAASWLTSHLQQHTRHPQYTRRYNST